VAPDFKDSAVLMRECVLACKDRLSLSLVISVLKFIFINYQNAVI